MIFITGDCHGSFGKFTQKHFSVQKSLTKEDYVIICGDFGGIWSNESLDKFIKAEDYELNTLDRRNFTTLFIDGNHENFDRLNAYPVKEWHGGLVHEIKPSVLHLMRGEVYEIDGKTFLAAGGAASHDIRDGVLEIDDPRISQWRKDYTKLFRINKLSWWKEELPNDQEIQNMWKNLAKHDFKVDYILTHEAPSSVLTLLDPYQHLYQPDEWSKTLQKVSEQVEFKRWFFGHYHIDRYINESFTALYRGFDTIREFSFQN